MITLIGCIAQRLEHVAYNDGVDGSNPSAPTILMGIQIEFNPDLALRNISEWQQGRRKREECIPEPLEVGQIYDFLKQGQRNYWLKGELPLVETAGNEQLSRPKASIIILEVTHFVEQGQIYTRGRYQVIEVFQDDQVHFESYVKI